MWTSFDNLHHALLQDLRVRIHSEAPPGELQSPCNVICTGAVAPTLKCEGCSRPNGHVAEMAHGEPNVKGCISSDVEDAAIEEVRSTLAVRAAEGVREPRGATPLLRISPAVVGCSVADLGAGRSANVQDSAVDQGGALSGADGTIAPPRPDTVVFACQAYSSAHGLWVRCVDVEGPGHGHCAPTGDPASGPDHIFCGEAGSEIVHSQPQLPPG
mmetsp:Transcript_22719/g.66152  ORF Transcript_22719/g.66152 Transcript_22719/m.66152 type:complete len:214 (-) Transcript_22719:337-978(-)